MPIPCDLPIQAFLPDIQQTLRHHPCCILQAEPGAGKSTQVPLALMNADWLEGRKILLLEPRRLAVRSLASFLASQLNESVGQSIGYQVRNDRKISKETRLEIITEGVLIRRLQQDPELSDTALIIFDEFHERSLEADLALALSLDSQQALREDLKILIMSATIESSHLSEFLDHAPVIQCPGRSFPVSTHYLTNSIANLHHTALYASLTLTLSKATKEHTGDCLIFLPGQKEIFKAISSVSEKLSEQAFALIPLYGGLSPEAQNKALQKDNKGRRKIIFATNIAETSLTIEGIHCVIDSGLVRKASYDSSSGMTRMLTQKNSKASAKQRAGRAGRLSAGHAYRLWTETEQLQKADFEVESILNSDLTDLTLEVAMWGETSPYNLQWLTPPPKAHYEIAKALLNQLEFLNEKGHVTKLGESANQLGLSSRLAKMLLIAAQYNAKQTGLDQCNNLLQSACDLAAIISERDIFRNPHSVNILDRLQALQAYRLNAKQAAKDYPLILPAVKEAITNSKQWHKRLNTMAVFTSVSTSFTNNLASLSTGQLLALAYPDRIAKRRSNDSHRYQLSNGKGTFLNEDDALTSEEWLVVANLDGQRREGRTFMACPISLVEIQTLFQKQISEQNHIEFDAKKQAIQGTKSQKVGAITLTKSPIKNLSRQQIQDCLIATLKSTQLKALPWHKNTLEWLNRVRWLGQYLPEFEGFSTQDLIEDFDNWCVPYLSHIDKWTDLAKLDLLSLLQARLSYDQLNTLNKAAPTHYTAPSHKKVTIEYHIDKLPKISIQLQELFGEIKSPSLANGQVNLTFELLSPARRPIQVTSDLANFWQNSYIEVAKEMRGKYPRHRWPEKPLEEKAGRSIQPRKNFKQK